MKILKKGYVGCCMRVLSKRDDFGFDWDQIKEAEVIAEGWVDLKSEPRLGKGSGIITNLQILTKGVRICKLYEKKLVY